MANQVFSGFVYDQCGNPVNGAAVALFTRNSATSSTSSGCATATTTSNACGFWTISTATENRFDVRISNSCLVLWRKYDDQVQLERAEFADVFVRNPANTFDYQLAPAAILADRVLNLPLITGTDTLPAIGLAQTWTADQTFNDNVNVTFGTGGDADIDYDGTNLVINPQVVGSGFVDIAAGNLVINAGNLRVDGGCIGVCGDTNLVGMAANTFTVRGQADIEGYAAFGNGSALNADFTLVVDRDFTASVCSSPAVVSLTGSTITEGASGTHPRIMGVSIVPPTITAGAGAVTDTASLYISAAPCASGAANWSIMVDAGNTRLDGTIYLLEQACACADIEAFGQIWVNTNTPNQLFFTNDAGTDLQLCSAGAVTALNCATANELVTIGATTTELCAESGLTYDGTTFAIVTGNLDLTCGTISNVGAAGNDWTANRLALSSTNAGGVNDIRVLNTGTTASSDSEFLAFVGGACAGDPRLAFLVCGGEHVAIGLDNSSSDNFTISDACQIGTNDRLRLVTATGILSVDGAGSGCAAQVDLFDKYCDPNELRVFQRANLFTVEDQQRNQARLVELGVAEWAEQEDGSQHWMMRIQPMMRLLAGGIWQNRQRLVELEEENCRLKGRLESLNA